MQRQFRHFGKWETQTHDRRMPYNEVFTRAHQSMLVGLFSRSCERQHLMFLMAARQEVKETVGLWLPLFVHTSEDGYQPFPSHSQTGLLKVHHPPLTTRPPPPTAHHHNRHPLRSPPFRTT